MTYERATIEEYGYKDYKFLKKFYKIFTIVLSVLVVLGLYISIIMLAIQSVNKSASVTSFSGFTLRWYREMFSSRSLTNAIKNTIVTSIISTALSTIIGTLIAVGIYSYNKKNRQQIMLFNNIPLLNADIVTGISLMLVFSMLLPIFPYIFGPTTLIMAHLFFSLPYVILSVMPKLKEMDKNLLDAALDLGVKPFRALRKVIVPAVMAGIFSGMLLAFTMSIDDFVISYYTTGNGFDNLSIWVYGSIGKKSLTPSVYAFSTLLTVFTLFTMLLYQYFMHRGKKK
jgi:spermidine/putrescine transport system permease protein